MNIPIAFNADLLEDGILKYEFWDTAKSPHLLLCGVTGNGKSTAEKLLLARIGLHFSEAKIWFADFKGDDAFRFLRKSPRYFAYWDCTTGLNEFYNAFVERQSGRDSSRSFIALFWDEWSAYVSAIDKKAAEEIKRKLTVLAMMGRGFNAHLSLCMQRPDAIHLANGMRDQLGTVLALGELSTEGMHMAFPGISKEEFPPISSCIGSGRLAVNGLPPVAVRVPTARNMRKVEWYCKQAVSR